MRISDWSSDVCSSDLAAQDLHALFRGVFGQREGVDSGGLPRRHDDPHHAECALAAAIPEKAVRGLAVVVVVLQAGGAAPRILEAAVQAIHEVPHAERFLEILGAHRRALAKGGIEVTQRIGPFFGGPFFGGGACHLVVATAQWLVRRGKRGGYEARRWLAASSLTFLTESLMIVFAALECPTQGGRRKVLMKKVPRRMLDSKEN